ncbi:hypothetical protein NEOLEDRAFT_290105 [Neolentinus lepideus HHB14362 ss-1]|uniref:Uncharacterized protein n=1 Tax=Neolentinus lepideus HHB14362 ss-1 TaxID=1314782 RepID=A0A165SZV3_9AGAM|nr:hypothetical protein NEOLEDRAFT_290105 [Neolentinus lepideus HHB14362 ss-1]
MIVFADCDRSGKIRLLGRCTGLMAHYVDVSQHLRVRTDRVMGLASCISQACHPAIVIRPVSSHTQMRDALAFLRHACRSFLESLDDRWCTEPIIALPLDVSLDVHLPRHERIHESILVLLALASSLSTAYFFRSGPLRLWCARDL